MLNIFDWLRRCESGAELLATLRYFAKPPKSAADEFEMGAPLSALEGPCRRCLLYARDGQEEYCRLCAAILDRARRLTRTSRISVVVWGLVNQIPQQVRAMDGSSSPLLMGSYVHEGNQFLVMMYRRKLKTWLQDVLLYHGAEIRGLLQIFPTVGLRGRLSMGEVLCYASHYAPRQPADRFTAQFYSSSFQLLKPRTRDRHGLLTFEMAEFLSLLEMAEVFRARLYPAEQRQLHELLELDDAKEEQFYWGRFLGQLNQEAKDMLAAWRIRQWPKPRVKLLYELIEYAALPNTD
jgi:hypothetical protein